MTRVALLWHMHQPFYEDLATGEHVLPWVRFHAMKDYWGMVALLREFPDVKVTFNLVPSLLVQLEAFAEDRARDRHLAIGLKPATALSDEERAFCIDEFFHAHRPRMIDPYPRYAELLDRRDANGGRPGAKLARSVTWIWTPPQVAFACLWKVGSKTVDLKCTPGARRALSASANRSSVTQGAPFSSKGRVVPRPSDTLVPSKTTVPG